MSSSVKRWVTILLSVLFIVGTVCIVLPAIQKVQAAGETYTTTLTFTAKPDPAVQVQSVDVYIGNKTKYTLGSSIQTDSSTENFKVYVWAKHAASNSSGLYDTITISSQQSATNVSGSVKFSNKYAPDLAYTYTVTRVPNTKTVTYNSNGGNAVNPGSVNVSGGGSTSLPTPTRNGYTFNGWYTAASGGNKVGNGGSAYTPTADITLYAQWTATPASAPTSVSMTDTAVSYTYGKNSSGDKYFQASAQSPSGHKLSYQWYENSTASNQGGTKINGATSSKYVIPNSTSAGTHYYYCLITATREDNNLSESKAAPVGTLTVSKADIKITPDNKTGVYGDDITDLTYQVSGDYVSGDNLGIKLATVAEKTSNTGNYKISVQWNNNNNYNATLEEGTYSITRANAVVTANPAFKTYGSGEPIFSAKITGLKNNDSASLISYLLSRSTGKNAGTYDITPTGDAVQGNYNVSFVKGKMTINQLTAELKWSDTSFEYIGSEQIPGATVSNLIGDDTCDVTVSGAKTDTGTYTAEATALSNSNYKLPENKTVSFTIEKNDDTNKDNITDGQKPTPNELTFNNRLQELVTAPSELPDGYTKVEYRLYDGEEWKDNIPSKAFVGDYTVQVKYVGDKNHVDFIGDSIDVTISKEAVTISAIDQQVMLGEDIEIGTDKAVLEGAVEGSIIKTIVLNCSGTDKATRHGVITASDAAIFDKANNDITSNYEITYVQAVLTVVDINKHISADVVAGEDIKDLEVKDLDEELAKAILDEEELADYEVGVPIHVYLEVSYSDEKDIEEEDKSLTEAQAKRLNAKIGTYIDLSLWKQVGENAAQKIENTDGNKIAVTISIPEALINKKADVERTFYIVRVHDGKTEILAETKDNTVTFETDKFSTYSIVYSDKAILQDKTSPKTGDNGNLGLRFALMILSLFVIAATLLFGRKKRVYNR